MPNTLAAQVMMQVDPSNSPRDGDLWITGASGIEAIIGDQGQISNVSFTGSRQAAGTFTGGSDSILIGEGVVLGSGAVRDVVGPRVSAGGDVVVKQFIAYLNTGFGGP